MPTKGRSQNEPAAAKGTVVKKNLPATEPVATESARIEGHEDDISAGKDAGRKEGESGESKGSGKSAKKTGTPSTQDPEIGYELAQERARSARSEVIELESEQRRLLRMKEEPGRRQRLEDVSERLEGAKQAKENFEQAAKTAEWDLRQSTLPLHRKLAAAARNRTAFRAVRDRAKGIDSISKLKTKNLEVDHLASIRRITQLRGFADLSWEAQIEIVNMPENLIPMDGSANASKGAQLWSEWVVARDYYPTPGTVGNMIEKETKVWAEIGRMTSLTRNGSSANSGILPDRATDGAATTRLRSM